MSFADAFFRVIAIAAITYCIWSLARLDQRARRHRRMATPHHSVRRNSTEAVP